MIKANWQVPIKDDRNLLERIKLDDYSSFNLLFGKYYGRLTAYAFRITQDRAAAEDITQDLLVKFWTQRHRIQVTEDLLGYLLRSSRNASIDYLRGERSRKDRLENYTTLNADSERDHLEEQEFISFVEECIDELPERCKRVFRMSRIDGCKQSEIAEKLNISVKTIKNQIWKSLQYMRLCLKQKDAM